MKFFNTQSIIILVILFTLFSNPAHANNKDALASAFSVAAGQVFAERILQGSDVSKFTQCTDSVIVSIDFDALATAMKYERAHMARVIPKIRNIFRKQCP